MAWCSEVYSRRSTTGMAVPPEYSRGGLTEEYCRGVWGIHGKACLTLVTAANSTKT
jgi:hypothetical protein